MKVKKYVAATMPEVMQKVRKELGSDAVILNSKVIYTGGFLGLFKKRNIEVVAAIEPEPVRRSPNHTVKSPVKHHFKIEKETKDKEQKIVLEELRSLRKWMESKSEDDQPVFSAAFESVRDHLLAQEVDQTITDQLLKTVYEQVNRDDLTYQEAKQSVESHLVSFFANYECGAITYEKRFVHLVGPTGVGKTTTIAKLAANSMIKDGKKVALITTDTYRIAAIEQLKTYSKILDIPLEIAYTMEDYQKARLKFQHYDVVFVDTAGRNFRDPKYVAELGQIVDLEHDIETYLVLSLTAKSNDLVSIFKQFHAIPLKKLIFTKTDETMSYGAILNLISHYQIGIAYLTHGQDVPDDIKEAEPGMLVELLMGSHDENV
ncbi:flagellar biosynthesis protein FlhF [Amphibacillus jilinensis]|uniref:flagellar biosynthesis protein FlhF n=1 Tax=Amphibacillus jilinensis TaxID=1216008 RepID=UPI0002E00912|nr:flagellar biosynthesis protein FlhF [Amphibacillus jilinensis]